MSEQTSILDRMFMSVLVPRPIPPKRAKPMTHDEIVRAVMTTSMCSWWTPRGLREAIERRHGVSIEAITAAIRRLRQPPHNLKVACERVPGLRAYRYKVVP